MEHFESIATITKEFKVKARTFQLFDIELGTYQQVTETKELPTHMPVFIDKSETLTYTSRNPILHQPSLSPPMSSYFEKQPNFTQTQNIQEQALTSDSILNSSLYTDSMIVSSDKLKSEPFCEI